MLNNSINSLQKRLLAIFLLVTFIFLIIIFRLVYLQLINGNWLQMKAQGQWSRDLPLNAKRGNIYDSNGVALAVSYTTYDVYVRPSMIENDNLVAVTLSETLDIDYDTLISKISQKQYSEVLIKMQISNEQAEKLKIANVKGIKLSENNSRFYPYGDLATQLLGFTTIDNIGQAGLEAQYDKYLTGVDGYAVEQSDVNGVKIENTLNYYIPSISGCDLNLTIDVNIQKASEKALMHLMEEQRPKTATAIVMNVNSGEIVALSSKPSFDLNNPPRDDVETLLDNVRNLSIVDVYEPGSTFKVLTMASALDAGVAHLSDTFYDPGFCMLDGEKIKCWKSIGHGSQTLTEGLCNSCNTVFVDLALRLGKDRMYEYFSKYGLGKTLGVDFLGEASGILMDKEDAKNVDLARMGFGQAIAVSPIQLITAICSVLNGGNLMKPYLVKSVTDSFGTTIYENSPQKIRNTVSADTSEKIRGMFEQVVKQYSGINAFIEGYRIGGKTGTSQKYVNGAIGDKYISSFIGAFPADKPEYAVLIIADEPSAGNYFGSVVATPYAKEIMVDMLQYLKYEPMNLEEDKAKMEKNIVMPNLVGKSIVEAVNILNELCLQFEISGEGYYITSQTPAPSTLLYKYAIVVLTA